MKICPFCNEAFDGAKHYCSSCSANIEIIRKTFFIDGFERLYSIVYYNDFFREHLFNYKFGMPVSYTHLTLPTKLEWCRSRWSPYH